jgi:hypothetical protein
MRVCKSTSLLKLSPLDLKYLLRVYLKGIGSGELRNNV